MCNDKRSLNSHHLVDPELLQPVDVNPPFELSVEVLPVVRSAVVPLPGFQNAGEIVWTHQNNSFGWSALLGNAPGSDDVSPYAAAARAENLKGLPPTFISTDALDLFLEEDIEYARRLMHHGVPVELHVYPGTYHGFDVFTEAQVALAARRDSREALCRTLHSAGQQLTKKSDRIKKDHRNA